MLIKRFDDLKLAQRSYLIGCADTGEALVVDPNRDLEQYVKAAEAAGVRITGVTETHIHADFVSGSRELAEWTGATLFLSGEGGEEWKYSFAPAAGVVLLEEGGTFHVGRVKIDVVHTPGHTPEHLTLLVTDAGGLAPMGALTGDFVFVGDVGRPDLLERAAKIRNSAELAARALFQSLQRFKAQPDYLQIWPGHGAGSACGKGISAVPQSTVGYERRFNWAFGVTDEDEFVRLVLAGQPEVPSYFAEMKRLNKEGPRTLGGFRRPQQLPPKKLGALLDAGALVVDTRPAAVYAKGHVPGTVNIPLNHSFTTWAGWLIPYNRDFHLITAEACSPCLDEAVRDLAMIGLDRIAGYFGGDVGAATLAEGAALDTAPRLTAPEVAERLARGDATLLDVRWQSEWDAGHLPGAVNIPLGHLTDRLGELPKDQTIVVHCQGGGRSAIAASVLRGEGFEDVVELAGGFAEWAAAGNSVERKGELTTTPRSPR